MDDLKKTISDMAIYEGLTDSDLDSLVRIACEKAFQKGSIIFFDGEYSDGFYVVIAGRIKITKISAKGKEQILYILGAGEPFGQLALYHGGVFPATAQALEKSTCLFFPKNPFLKLVSENPAMPFNMLAFLSRRHRELALQIENIALKEVPERLAGYLLYLLNEQKTSKPFNLPIPKEQLAYLLGASPETLSRALAKMVDQQIISMHGKSVTVLDKNGLKTMASANH